MKLDKFIEMIKSQSDEDNPEIKFLPLAVGTAQNLIEDVKIEFYNRSDYYDESLLGTEIPQEKIVVVEIGE